MIFCICISHLSIARAKYRTSTNNLEEDEIIFIHSWRDLSQLTGSKAVPSQWKDLAEKSCSTIGIWNAEGPDIVPKSISQ